MTLHTSPQARLLVLLPGRSYNDMANVYDCVRLFFSSLSSTEAKLGSISHENFNPRNPKRSYERRPEAF